MSDRNALVAAVASGKGGVGKSTLAVSLATAAALQGKQTLVIEFDAGLRGMDIMLDLSGIVYDLGDLLEGRCNISNAILESPFIQGLFAIVAPAVMSAPMELYDIKLLLSGLRPHFDLIILDMPAGLGFSIQAARAAADMMFAVATPDPVSVRASGALIQTLTSAGPFRHRLIINRVNRKNIRRQVISDLDEVIDGVGSQLIGVVPEDMDAQLAAASGNPPSQNGPLMKTCSAIISRLFGEYVPLLVC